VGPRAGLDAVAKRKLAPCVDKIAGDHLCGFNVTDELLIRYSALARF